MLFELRSERVRAQLGRAMGAVVSTNRFLGAQTESVTEGAPGAYLESAAPCCSLLSGEKLERAKCGPLLMLAPFPVRPIQQYIQFDTAEICI